MPSCADSFSRVIADHWKHGYKLCIHERLCLCSAKEELLPWKGPYHNGCHWRVHASRDIRATKGQEDEWVHRCHLQRKPNILRVNRAIRQTRYFWLPLTVPRRKGKTSWRSIVVLAVYCITIAMKLILIRILDSYAEYETANQYLANWE